MLLLLLAAGDAVKGTGDVVQVDVNFLTWILGFGVPVVTAIVTTKVASSSLKAIVTAVLAAIAGLIAVAIEANGHIDISQWVVGVGQAAIAAWAAYYGFWKPTLIAPKLQDATKNFGIGERTTV